MKAFLFAMGLVLTVEQLQRNRSKALLRPCKKR